MFGSSKKSETFKYEVEVNSLIREATAGLNQRVLALEITNQQLIQHNQKLEFELQTLKQTLYTDVQRLEKRITDFTDLWHPIMSENMNRIKAELEETIIKAEREDIQKVSFELENKLTNINNLVTIGRINWSNHIIVPKDYDFKYDGGFSKWWKNQANYGFVYLEELKKLTNLNELDFMYFSGTIRTSDNEELDIGVIHNLVTNQYSKALNIQMKKGIKAILDFCNKYNIKIKHNEKEFNQFGISIKQLLEQHII